MENEALDYEASFDADMESIFASGDEADQPEAGSEETEGTEAEGAEGEDTEGTESADETGDAGADQPDGGEGDVYHLKWMDETRDVSRDEVIRLAQQGLDYDRVRQKYDEGKATISRLQKYYDENAEIVDDLRDFMEENKLENLGDALDAMRVARLTQGGTQRDIAIERVKRGRAERALARAQKQTEQQKETEKQESKAASEVKAFMEAHPDVDLKKLLPELEKDVNETHDLEKAYLRYEVRRYKKEAADAKETAKAEQKNADNKKRSTGSMKSAGGGSDGVIEELGRYLLS